MAVATKTEITIMAAITAFICWWLYTNKEGAAYLVISWVALLLLYTWYRESNEK